MTRDEFWSIIERSRRRWDAVRSEENLDRQVQDLKALLSPLSATEVASFRRHAVELYYAAYRWDLWHAGHIMGQGCSDDGFMDFRGWLISMGRSTYERAMADVESLADIDRPDVFFEEFMSVPAEVYEMKTGKELDLKIEHPMEPVGQRLPEDEFPVRFPGLWKKFDNL